VRTPSSIPPPPPPLRPTHTVEHPAQLELGHLELGAFQIDEAIEQLQVQLAQRRDAGLGQRADLFDGAARRGDVAGTHGLFALDHQRVGEQFRPRTGACVPHRRRGAGQGRARVAVGV
jgi:hypothetical protein